MGYIAPKIVYRSNHPVCNGKQVPDIISLANYAKINTVINLSDDIAALITKTVVCPWYRTIYEHNSVIALNIRMQFDIMGKRFMEKIKYGLQFMINHEPPYLIHCEAGIDRTGFMSILLESFMGAGFNDIVNDYMLSYVEPGEYSTDDYKTGSLFIRNTFSKIKGTTFTLNEDLKRLSRKYLLEKIGLTDEKLNLLANKLIR
jgi:protein tyrosine/serine phosphatase